MRKRSFKIVLIALAATAVLGVGVAVAASSPSWAGGGSAQTTQVTPGSGPTNGMQLRARDGTGPRHSQNQTHRGQQRLRDGTGPRHDQRSAPNANRGANCPYRS
jgi:hypothetical protein